MWKKLFFAVSVLLVSSLVLSGYLWQQLDFIRTPPYVVAAQLKDTRDRLDSAQSRLTDAEAVLADMEMQLETSRMLQRINEADNQRLRESYDGLRAEVNRRLGYPEYVQSFITPDNPAVSAKVQEITGHLSKAPSDYWRGCDNLFRWVSQNVEYTQDTYTPVLPAELGDGVGWSREFWRTPEETIADKSGDCEDMCVLLASMLLNYNKEKYGVWVVEIGNKNEGHVAVALPVADGQLTILDPSAWYVTGPNGYLLSSRELNTSVNSWLENWREKIPDVQVHAVFSNRFYQTFATTQEFIDWADERIRNPY